MGLVSGLSSDVHVNVVSERLEKARLSLVPTLVEKVTDWRQDVAH